MEPDDAQRVIRMVEANWQFDLGTDGRVIWRQELLSHDADIAVRAVASLAKFPLPSNRSRPQLADLRAAIITTQKNDQTKQIHETASVSPMRRPAWVDRWRRARDAGDMRPFPEQALGFEALRRLHPANMAAYATPHVKHDSIEHWVQPNEYADQEALEVSDVSIVGAS